MISLITKICTKCNIEKPLFDFPKANVQKNSFHSHCKACRLEYAKIHRKENSDHYKDLDRKQGLKKLGITLEQWDLKFNEQNGCCAICGSHQSKLGRTLVSDHSHLTGKFRGLLCDSCNLGIGKLQDNLSIVLLAAEYLSKYLS